MKTLFAFFCAAVAILQVGCGKNPSGPKDVPKDPRQYAWTVDTLAYPGSLQTNMYKSWGSSPKDVYVVGHNDRGFGKMFHFDGNRWSAVDQRHPDAQGNAAIDLSAIYGFAANDIWAVGQRIYSNPNPPPNFLDSSLVIHYDGVRWQEVKLKRGRVLQSIWGSAPNDIWMGGVNGTLYHYDGTSVKRDSVPLVIPKNAEPFYNFFSIAGRTSDEVYLLLLAPPPGVLTDHFYLLQRQSNHWVVVDSIFSWRNRLWMSPAVVLYATGNGVHKRVGTSWIRVLDYVTTIGMYGLSENNFFAVGNSPVGGLSGEVYHYNGVDWYQFKNLQLLNVQYTDVWTDGKEAFVIGVTFGDYPQKTIILHGK